MYILTNISRSKDNKAMKYSQLIEYNKRHTFLKKSYIKLQTIPRSFPKKLKLSIYLNQWSKVLYGLFLIYAKFRVSKYIEAKIQAT